MQNVPDLVAIFNAKTYAFRCKKKCRATIYSRIVAIVLIPILLGAIFTVHGPAGFFFTNPNGGWEFPAFWIVGLLALALTGDGKYALKPTPFKG